jgi:hypothetical protein
MWGAEDIPEMDPSGDVVIGKPPSGWSFAFYEAVVQQYRLTRGHYPRTARMHRSTAIAIASRSHPAQWPAHELRAATPVNRITLTDDELRRHD